ncbi:MAG: hypothetical protein UW76_C0038G0005 [Parcubacteria group bacterium GW2011_GWF2_44_8b]|nr:MAG: hypothetical protein UW76_C0038G0005 [Parcubacteria group bacterium GW2011_GWF2_44_8b]
MMEGVLILAVLIVIMIVTLMGDSDSTTNPSNPSVNNGSGGENIVTSDSSHALNISLGTGNASYAYQPYEEYITIDNREREPVDITNWQLKNAKDKRAYDLGGSLKYFPADTAKIGRAAPFVSPMGTNIFQNVILQDGETAVITTGLIGSQLPYKIVSFKENICSGFLEDLPEYTFTPPLARNCPRPTDEPGVSALDTECRKFIERMTPCRTPEFNTRDREEDICYNCVDGKLLSSSCVAFIKSHFNYGSCIANHASNPNFSGRTWRIFLGKGWEMWAEDYETIELFDQLGRLVDSRSY